MPDNPSQHLPFRRRPLGFGTALALAAVCVAAGFVPAQPKSMDPPKASALRLPDGTVVLYTRNPDDANPPVEGVMLSGKEYQTLLEQADQLRRSKDAARPMTPSRCQVRAKVEATGGQPMAVLTATYSFRTTAPRAVVALGGQRGQPRAARLADGRLPVLGVADDGLTALIDRPGDHDLTVEFETPVVARGGNKELGFDVGLPRAPVTTFGFDPPPAGTGITVGTRTPDRPGEVQRSAYRPDAALGPTDLLDVTWEPPTPAGPVAVQEATAESEVSVRVDDVQVETTAKVRLRGPGRDWQLVFPPGADVIAERAGAEVGPPAGSVAITRSGDPNKPVWTLRVPDGPPVEWVVTAVARQPRVKSADPKHRATYPIGPVAVPAARHAGTVRVSAPPTVSLRFQPGGPEVRRQDLPPGAGDDAVALFRFAFPPTSAAKVRPLLDIDARPVAGFLRIEPAYRLRLVPNGWALTADLKVTPVRAEVDDLRVELPDGWQGGVEASARRPGADASELVDESDVRKDGAGPRELVVRLAGPQKAPFDMTLTTVYPVPAGTREVTVSLPSFPQSVVEQGAKLTAEVPTGLEVRGSAVGRFRGQPGEAIDLKPPTPASADPKTVGGNTTVAGTFERGVGQVSLGWQPYRPEMTARVEVEVTLQDRQLAVTETVHLKAEGGAWRAARFRGPAAATATLNAPLLRQAGDAGEWELVPQPATAKDAPPITLSYVLPVPPKPGQFDIGLFWPELATRVDTQLRVWGGPGVGRVTGFTGPWQKLAPEPAEGRDSLPWLTLAGTGTGLKLGLDIADPADGPLPGVWVERARFRAWVGGETVALHGRFLLRRWSAAGIDLVLPPGAAPEVFVDGRRAENLISAPATGTNPGAPRAVRVPVPEPRAGRGLISLDVWYLLPVPGRTVGPLRITPPVLAAAAYRSPARWQVFAPPGVVPLYVGADLRPDVAWVWRGGLLIPMPSGSTVDPDDGTTGGEADPTPAWATSVQSGAPAELLAGRQSEVGPATLYRAPWAGWVAGCSMAALLLVLGFSRLRPELLGPAAAAAGVLAAVLAAVWPQPAAEVVGGCQPGVWAAAAVLASQAALRWYYRRRVTHLPGFTRSRPESGVYGPPIGLAVPGVQYADGSGSAAVPYDGTGGTNSMGSARG